MTDVIKPIVECRLLSPVVVGCKVCIVPYDHPKDELNGKRCMTSKALNVTVKQDSFETENTVYKVV